MTIEHAKSSQKYLFYEPARERVKEVLQNHQFPIALEDWREITGAQVLDIADYLDHIYHATSVITPGVQESDIPLLNAEKGSLDEHLLIMRTYTDVLFENTQFKSECELNNVSLPFLHLVVNLHDFSRFLFNGRYPQSFVDGVSDGLVHKLFPGFPEDYHHRVDWMTGKVQYPESPDFPHKIALIMKTLDTVSKIDASTGQIRQVNTLFTGLNGEPAGYGDAYLQWMDRQRNYDRFPLQYFVPVHDESTQTIVGRAIREVTLDDYAQRDRELTLAGAALIESFGMSFYEVTQETNQRVLTART